jgi:hypothetical protein
MEGAHKIIANYMKASTALETYLHKNGALTPLQEQSVYTTLKMTQTFVRRVAAKNTRLKTDPLPPILYTMRQPAHRIH